MGKWNCANRKGRLWCHKRDSYERNTSICQLSILIIQYENKYSIEVYDGEKQTSFDILISDLEGKANTYAYNGCYDLENALKLELKCGLFESDAMAEEEVKVTENI